MTYPSESVTSTAPGTGIVDLDDLKTVMRKAGNSEDYDLGRYLDAAINAVTELCLPIQPSTVVDTFDGDGRNGALTLGQFPVQSVVSVLVFDYSGTSSAIVEAGAALGVASGYRVDKIAGVLRRVGAGAWPAGYGNVQITYTVGLDPIPPAVTAATIDLAQHFWRYRILPSSGGGQVNADPQGYEMSNDMPQSILGLLRPYLKPPRVA